MENLSKFLLKRQEPSLLCLIQVFFAPGLSPRSPGGSGAPETRSLLRGVWSRSGKTVPLDPRSPEEPRRAAGPGGAPAAAGGARHNTIQGRVPTRPNQRRSLLIGRRSAGRGHAHLLSSRLLWSRWTGSIRTAASPSSGCTWTLNTWI